MNAVQKRKRTEKKTINEILSFQHCLFILSIIYQVIQSKSNAIRFNILRAQVIFLQRFWTRHRSSVWCLHSPQTLFLAQRRKRHPLAPECQNRFRRTLSRFHVEAFPPKTAGILYFLALRDWSSTYSSFSSHIPSFWIFYYSRLSVSFFPFYPPQFWYWSGHRARQRHLFCVVVSVFVDTGAFSNLLSIFTFLGGSLVPVPFLFEFIVFMPELAGMKIVANK